MQVEGLKGRVYDETDVIGKTKRCLYGSRTDGVSERVQRRQALPGSGPGVYRGET